MLTKTNIQFNINPIIEQVFSLSWTEKSIVLNETSGTLLNGPYTILPKFVNTPLGDALAKLGNIGEARLLRLEPGETYSAHTDPDDRLHLSIISNEFCYLANLEDNTIHTLPVDGYIWELDTSIRHSAFNLGSYVRINLNVRKLLPAFAEPGYAVTADGDKFNWKQELYLDIMGYINCKIKEGVITGFTKIDERTIMINTNDRTALNYLVNISNLKGYHLDVTPVGFE